MKNTDLKIDLDEKIIKYMDEKKCDKNIVEYIEKIVDLLIEDQELYIQKIYVSIQSATKIEIKELNKNFRGKDMPTDVLSFPIFEKNELDELKAQIDENKKIKEIELGDIILCLDIIEEQSIEYETGIFREILYMITHGMCHLLGYDHIEESDKKIMRALEEKILDKIGAIR